MIYEEYGTLCHEILIVILIESQQIYLAKMSTKKEI